MGIWKSLILVLLVPQISQAVCFERFYDAAHLKKHPQQVVKNILFDQSYDYNPYTTKSEEKFHLQIQMEISGEVIVADATAQCEEIKGNNNNYQEGFCTIDAPGKGSFTYKIDNPWGFYSSKSVLINLSGDSQLVNITRGKSGLVAVPKYDHSMLVYQNELVSSMVNTCEPVLYQAYTTSVPRFWNEVILHSIRNDLARPTVTARNLFHLSALMWDINAAYTDGTQGYFIDRSAPATQNPEMAMQIAMSYAAADFLRERYKLAPSNTVDNFPIGDGDSGDGQEDRYLDQFYDRVIEKLDIDEKKWDQHIQFAKTMSKDLIAMNLNDGSREESNYSAEPSYKLINSGILDVSQSGMTTPPSQDPNDMIDAYYVLMNEVDTSVYQFLPLVFKSTDYHGDKFAQDVDINYWVRLNIPGSIDQGGASVASEQSPLTVFWGRLPTFGNLSSFKSGSKEGVYFDPVDSLPTFEQNPEEFIKKNIEVMELSALLNPLNMSAHDFDGDGKKDKNPGAELIDISPGRLGNNTLGTNDGKGRSKNPVTGQPYQSNKVKVADYYRSIAEFWADGPQSETPPGHWNTLANYVVDEMKNNNESYRWNGQGPEMGRELYELKLYLTLNGALHDAAVVAWGLKGFYQGSRPVVVVRKLAEMAEKDPDFADQLVSYSDHLKMVEFREVTYSKTGEVIYGKKMRKLAVKAWRGPRPGAFYQTEIMGPDLRNLSYRYRDEVAIEENQFFSQNNISGTGWILVENWMPYQRQSFVTPPFPGFVSGHSTFSRAAAEVLTAVTGSEYFPGGLGVYRAPQLHFESQQEKPFDFHWATYFDASDVSGQSRIYGGIHASYDDLPARKIGSKVGQEAFKAADQFFKQSDFLD